jgi:hypothetical protein
MMKAMTMCCRVFAAAVLAGGVAACTKQSIPEVPPDAMSRESIRSLPDFSGWWLWDYAASKDNPILPLGQAPLRPEVAAAMKAVLANIFDTSRTTRTDPSPGGYCVPPRFFGANVIRGAAGQVAMEFLYTPGRVTILDEAGMVRRISLNQPLPADPAASHGGTSVGHWEGHTLVVETTGFDGDATFVPPFKYGRHIHTIERISSREPDVLEIALTMTAPDIFSGTFEHTYTYRRDPKHVFFEYTTCVENDRSVDPKSQGQRFDLTPPQDLPPPPSE